MLVMSREECSRYRRSRKGRSSPSDEWIHETKNWQKNLNEVDLGFVLEPGWCRPEEYKQYLAAVC